MSTQTTIESVIKQLRSRETRSRMEAYDQLMDLAEIEDLREIFISSLAPLLGDDDPFIRGTALLGYGLAQAEKALPLLSRYVDDAASLVRRNLALALSGIGDGARHLLLRLVEDREFDVRFAAAKGLAKLNDSAGVPVLIEGLADREWRLDALMSLLAAGDERAIPAVRRWFRKLFASGFERTAAAGVLARLGDEEASHWLVERIRQRRGADRGLAIEICGELRLLGATQALQSTLGDRGDLFRGAAARSLGRMKEERLVDELTAILVDESEDPDVRMDVAEGLMHVGTSKAREVLHAALMAVQNEEVRGGVQEALDLVEP